MQWHEDDDGDDTDSQLSRETIANDGPTGKVLVHSFVESCLSLRQLVTQNRCQSVECIAFKVLAHKSNRRARLHARACADRGTTSTHGRWF